MNKNKKIIDKILQEKNITLRSVFELVRSKKYILIIGTIFGLFYSIYLSATTPKEFYSKSKFLIESTSGNNNNTGLTGIASLAGINLNSSNNSEVLEPSIYPKIVESDLFLLDLSYENFIDISNNNSTFLYYFNKNGHNKNENNIPYLKHKNTFQKPDNLEINKINSFEKNSILQLGKRINVKIDSRFLEITTKMPDPMLSAELTKKVTEKLIQYVINYKTTKRKRDTDFIRQRTEEAKKNYQIAQEELASFKDNSLGMQMQFSKNKEDQIQNKLNILTNLYSSLVLQLEQSNLKLKEETPVFTQFSSITIPDESSEPNVLKIIGLYTTFAFFLSLLIVLMLLFKDYIS